MNHQQSIRAACSGILILGLATVAAFLFFSPSSTKIVKKDKELSQKEESITLQQPQTPEPINQKNETSASQPEGNHPSEPVIPEIPTISAPKPEVQPAQNTPQAPRQVIKEKSIPQKVVPKRPAAETKKGPTIGYWIQLASYSSLNRAKGAQEDLKKVGLNTNIEVSCPMETKKIMYRIKAGAWPSEKEAKRFLEDFRVAHKGFDDAFVVSSFL